jgi:hypothetical protein
MTETRINTGYDAEVTTQASRSISTGDRVIELGIEEGDGGTYATMSLRAAKELLASLAVEIAKAEMSE